MPDRQPCPNCGEAKARLSRHWTSHPDCSPPSIDGRQRAVVEGIVLAGGTVDGRGQHRHCVVGTTNDRLAAWLADALGWLHHGTRVETYDDDDRDPQHRVRTHAHPAIDRYERWNRHANGRGRIPPDDYRLRRLTARVWYALAGGLQWSGPYDSQRQALFSALHDDRAAWIQRLLRDAGRDPTRAGKRVQLPPAETTAFLEWIGPAVPGIEHKWADSLVEYRVLRGDAETRPGFEAALCREALRVARERTDQDLTPERFEARVDAVDAATVAAVLGGGSWSDALSVAGVALTPRTGHGGDGPRPERGQRHSDAELFDAVETVAERVDGVLSKGTYEANRDGSHPSWSTIHRRVGWSAAKKAAGLEIDSRGGDRSGSSDA